MALLKGIMHGRYQLILLGNATINMTNSSSHLFVQPLETLFLSLPY